MRCKQVTLKETTIRELSAKLSNISKNFADIVYRQVSWVGVKENINSLWNFFDNENSKDILTLLIDGVENLKAEKMKKTQIEGFIKILDLLHDDENSEIGLDDVIDIFIKHDIPALRFPRGAAELLD